LFDRSKNRCVFHRFFTDPKSYFFREHEGNKAVRLGGYKLVMKWNGVEKSKWELYDIAKDKN